MKIETAKKWLNEGKLISHRFFNDSEYIKRVNRVLLDESGNKLDEDFFWENRQGKQWKNCWFIYN
ncbi:hypothetical protein [uncultured Lutibacter sp.]|uniref:hypothetical protein n=1 Tax=uncultured Lutibacter sp. TaxID=437739 RepID=UPI002633121D|nr:hypothetical protein [uncultured Lutibacter sp.]